MKRAVFFLAISLFAAMLSSCSVTRETPEVEVPVSAWDKAWAGKTYSQITDKLGQPAMTVTDGRDGQVLVYDCISVDKPSGNYSARFFMNDRGVCKRVVHGEALSAAARKAYSDIPDFDEEDYYDDSPRARSAWSYILDNAVTVLLLVSFLVWFN